MNIRQLQLSYIPEHDRLLTRINTEDGAEIRFWLTRRLVRRLWPGLLKTSETVVVQGVSVQNPAVASVPEAHGMMTEMARQAALAGADFKTPFEAKPASLPLGEEPLLVTRVDMTPLVGPTVRMVFRQDEQRGFAVMMTPSLLHAFCTLMQKEAGQAQWDFNLDWPAAAAAGTSQAIN